MSDLILYVTMAGLTAISPGPGVLLTLSNTINYRFSNAIYGIMGTVMGTAGVGIIASTGLGIIMTLSPYVLIGIKIVGSGYLFYLGIKNFKAHSKIFTDEGIVQFVPKRYQLFSEAFIVAMLNPKAIIFFMALFPQFVDPSHSLVPQFILLISIICLSLIVSHSLYGSFGIFIRSKLSNKTFFMYLNRITGIIFILFSLSLIFSTLK